MWARAGLVTGDLNTKNVRRLDVRVEAHPVVVPAPGVALVGHQILDRIRLLAANAPLVNRYIQPAGLWPERIDIDHAHDDVGPIWGDLAVDQELVVVAAEEAQVVVQVQRRILAADAVDPPHVVDDVAGAVPIPDLLVAHSRGPVILGGPGNTPRRRFGH